MTKARDLSKLADGTEFTAADHSKLDAIEASATADQTSAQIKAAVEAATDSNVFTDADHSKLNAVEASADVTDTANVTAAGALMDSELTNLAAVKAINQSLVTTATPTFAGLNTTNINTASSTGTLTMFGGATNKGGTIELSGGNNTGSTGSGIVFKTGASTSSPAQRMAIDSSGRVLVAKTASGAGNVGAEMRTGVNDHAMVATTSGNASPLAVNRQTGGSGPLIQMYIANSHGANLSVDNTRLLVESAGDASGLRFDASGYTPFKNGTTANGTVDLGFSSGRFKDLYLSGGVVFGPASGSAVFSETLDDYEQGSFDFVQGTISGSSSDPTFSSGSASSRNGYTKIGKLVRVHFDSNFTLTSTGSGSLRVALPFAAEGSRNYSGCFGMRSNSWLTGVSDYEIKGYIAGSYFYVDAAVSSLVLNSSVRLCFDLLYTTA